VGKNGLYHHRDWDSCGPAVLISEWWLREHWGRAFAVVKIAPEFQNYSWAVLRKRDVELDPDELERPSDDPREVVALRHHIRQLQGEVVAELESNRVRHEWRSPTKGDGSASSTSESRLRAMGLLIEEEPTTDLSRRPFTDELSAKPLHHVPGLDSDQVRSHRPWVRDRDARSWWASSAACAPSVDAGHQSLRAEAGRRGRQVGRQPLGQVAQIARAKLF
jgi:hypothetical protein